MGLLPPSPSLRNKNLLCVCMCLSLSLSVTFSLSCSSLKVQRRQTTSWTLLRVSETYFSQPFLCSIHIYMPLIWTSVGQKKVSSLVRCPFFRECMAEWYIHTYLGWDFVERCPQGPQLVHKFCFVLSQRLRRWYCRQCYLKERV